ncbi:MAG: O-antigen ligase family protein [Hydrogenophilales bacterium]|nr:O-antigen ligase family protein [Hydrogenophilales bacterium]
MIRGLRDVLTSFHGWAWLLSFMLIFWAPLPGEQRLPATLLLPLGLWLSLRRREEVNSLPGLRELRWFFLMLIVPCLASLPFSQAPEATVNVLAILILSYWVGLVMLAGLASRPIRLLTWGITATLLFWSLDALLQWSYGVDLLGIPLHPEGRVLGIFRDNQHLGVMLGVLLPVLVLPLAKPRPAAAMACFGLVTFVIGLSGARAALVFAILAGAGLAYQLPGWRQRLGMLMLGMGVLVGAISLSPIHTQRLLERDYSSHLDNPAYSRNEALFLQADDFLSGRLKIWDTGWNMFQAHPLVGVGAGAFDAAYDRYSTRPDDQFTARGGYPGGVHHAHQLYVSAAAETGIIGLASLLALFVILIRWYRALRPAGQERAYPYAFSLCIAVFPFNSQHSVYIGWWFATLLFLACAMLVAGTEGNREGAPA